MISLSAVSDAASWVVTGTDSRRVLLKASLLMGISWPGPEHNTQLNHFTLTAPTLTSVQHWFNFTIYCDFNVWFDRVLLLLVITYFMFIV